MKTVYSVKIDKRTLNLFDDPELANLFAQIIAEEKGMVWDFDEKHYHYREGNGPQDTRIWVEEITYQPR